MTISKSMSRVKSLVLGTSTSGHQKNKSDPSSSTGTPQSEMTSDDDMFLRLRREAAEVVR